MRYFLLLTLLLFSSCDRSQPADLHTAEKWQSWVNAEVRYVDHGEFRVRSWSETIVRGGDCDDQAEVLYELLQHTNVDAKMSYGTLRKIPHAWVEWTDSTGTVWILDPSQRAYPIRKSGAYEYQPD